MTREEAIKIMKDLNEAQTAIKRLANTCPVCVMCDPVPIQKSSVFFALCEALQLFPVKVDSPKDMTVFRVTYSCLQFSITLQNVVLLGVAK